jgi:hypothetical protein
MSVSPGIRVGSLLLGATLNAMVSLGDLSETVEIDRVVLAGVSELTE